MSLSLEPGTSFGGLNAGGDFSDSSLSCPTDCTDYTDLNLLGSGGKVTQIAQMTQISSLLCCVPQIFMDYTDVLFGRGFRRWCVREYVMAKMTFAQSLR